MQYAPQTPLESCRGMLAALQSAGTDKAATAALYIAWIGYCPFADDPLATVADVQDTLRDYVKEVAVSFCVPWPDVIGN